MERQGYRVTIRALPETVTPFIDDGFEYGLDDVKDYLKGKEPNLFG